MEIIKEYLGGLLILVNEMSPYLLLGFFFAGLLRVFFPCRSMVTLRAGKIRDSEVRSILEKLGYRYSGRMDGR